MRAAVWYSPQAWEHIRNDVDVKYLFRPATVEDIFAAKQFGTTYPPSKCIGRILDSYVFIYDGAVLWGADVQS